MPSTTCYHIITPHLHPETVIAFLAELPFSSFETEEDKLHAYLATSDDNAPVQQAIAQLAERFSFTYSNEELPEENWNAQWERDYPVVEIDEWLRIRAPFHAPAPKFEHELVIHPEMSFGTGHHATTYMLSQLMRKHSPFGKNCFDFGTGTGVLAILAKKLGATEVVATDIDQRCVASTLQNAERNAIFLAEVRLGTQATLPAGPFDLILANINRNVLVEALPALAERLHAGGELWISGILASDQTFMTRIIEQAYLRVIEIIRREDWLAIRMTPSL